MNESAPRNNPRVGGSRDSNVDAATKTLQVLERVVFESGRLGVRELARELGFSKSTTSRILQALERRGYVRFDESESVYVPGAKILHLAGQHYRNLELRKIARPFMRKALDETGETVFLGMLEGPHVIVLDRIDSPSPLRMVTELGTREPAHGTALGKVLLAFEGSEPDLTCLGKAPFEAFTAHTITNATRLRKELRKVKKCGYAVDNEEHIEGVRCIAAPIHDAFGRTIAAISVSGPTFRLTDDHVDSVRTIVQRAAHAISWNLGDPGTEAQVDD